MPGLEIKSPQNERIKRLRRLRERRHRDNERVFVVEGARLFSRALEAGLVPLEVYTSGSVAAPDSAVEYRVESSVLDAASYRKTSEGLIAVFSQWSHGIDELELSTPSIVVVAESLEKPGNLGAMMRTAAAIGADGLVTIGGSCDPFNPNAIRSSTGALFSLPVVETDLADLDRWLADSSLTLMALTPDAPRTIWETDLTMSCALMVGAEDTGLSEEALELADVAISIPMNRDGIDSLNASVALAVAAYEASRQRSRANRDDL